MSTGLRSLLLLAVVTVCSASRADNTTNRHPDQSNPAAAKTLLCLPEVFWTCDGNGDCKKDDHPETLMAWKIDIPSSRYALCRRNGSECLDWSDFTSKWEFGYLVLHQGDLHPETFKIDLDLGKFVVVRLSGGFTDQPGASTPRPNLASLLIRQRTGSCIPLG